MLLTTVVFLPLAGALLVLLAGGRGDNPEREPLVPIRCPVPLTIKASWMPPCSRSRFSCES